MVIPLTAEDFYRYVISVKYINDIDDSMIVTRNTLPFKIHFNVGVNDKAHECGANNNFCSTVDSSPKAIIGKTYLFESKCYETNEETVE